MFGTGRDVGVRVRRLVPQVPGPDYVRLWACYQAKIVYNLGYPQNLSAMMALGSVAKVVAKDIDAAADCFQRADLADVARFVLDAPATGTVFTGEFYAKGSLDRRIKTYFPAQMSEQEVVYSGLALMQHAVVVNRADADSLRVLTETARHLLALYEAGAAVGLAAVVQVPTVAYMRALGIQ